MTLIKYIFKSGKEEKRDYGKKRRQEKISVGSIKKRPHYRKQWVGKKAKEEMLKEELKEQKDMPKILKKKFIEDAKNSE